ncbi:hypothetical protein ABZV60_33485 [Streptomyces sp. NPDC004787]|uniref:hypothetical protein n=1 Tax=Streptomyces sp. NPDC004787 TaxID=3154291 RepID=UPI0033A90807
MKKMTRGAAIAVAAGVALTGAGFAGASAAESDTSYTFVPIYSTTSSSAPKQMGWGSYEIRCNKDYRVVNYVSSAWVTTSNTDPGFAYEYSYEYRADKLEPTATEGEGRRIYRRAQNQQSYMPFRIKATITCAHKNSFHF